LLLNRFLERLARTFNEGGASGLLMNHLSLGIGPEGCMRVSFNASDLMGKVEEEEYQVLLLRPCPMPIESPF
jgi:hypothetical protein